MDRGWEHPSVAGACQHAVCRALFSAAPLLFFPPRYFQISILLPIRPRVMPVRSVQQQSLFAADTNARIWCKKVYIALARRLLPTLTNTVVPPRPPRAHSADIHLFYHQGHHIYLRIISSPATKRFLSGTPNIKKSPIWKSAAVNRCSANRVAQEDCLQ